MFVQCDFNIHFMVKKTVTFIFLNLPKNIKLSAFFASMCHANVIFFKTNIANLYENLFFFL